MNADLSPAEPTKPLVKAAPPPTPWTWRAGIALAILFVGLGAYLLHVAEFLGPRGQAAAGALCLFGLVALCSANLRAVSWRTVGLGVVLQVSLALFVLWSEPGYRLFRALAAAVDQLLAFSMAGSRFVFGALAEREAVERAFGPGKGMVFAFAALPPIIFVSSLFTVLYYLGVLQLVVRLLARVMILLMRTSGAETLSAVANVFMGQTEAPLIVKPYVGRMTQSELLALMVGGMATISGGLMAVYIQMGADPVAILATSVMAAPCGLYLSKLLLPELEEPETRGLVTRSPEPPHRNVIDAAAAGASDGLFLALNVAAMLIAFLAFLAMFDYLLGHFPVGQSLPAWLFDGGPWEALGKVALTLLGYGLLCLLFVRSAAWFALAPADWPRIAQVVALLLGYRYFLLLLHIMMVSLEQPLSLKVIFATVFAPLAFCIGVPGPDLAAVADLLGTKLVSNEFVAYLEMTTTYRDQLSPRSLILCTYALTGFANFASVGIQLGGIGAIAPERRPDLARLGTRALFVGFLATLLNAAVAGMLLD